MGVASTLKPFTATVPSSPTADYAKPSASPKPTTASPSAESADQASSSSPSAAASGTAACVTSAAQFNCGPFVYPQIEETSSNPTVGNNVWNPISGWQQTLYANNPGSWSVTANMPSGNTAVVSYPSSGSQYGNRALSSFSSMYSSFSEKMNANGSTSAWASYDIWLNGGKNEVMIQHDFANNGACSGPSATFGGSGGVPVQQWTLCGPWGSEYAWKLAGDEQSGSVDILAMLTWMVSHGYLPKNSTLSSIGYGWEIASTGGQPETFTVSQYSISAG
jgi:hypothetical protein